MSISEYPKYGVFVVPDPDADSHLSSMFGPNHTFQVPLVSRDFFEFLHGENDSKKAETLAKFFFFKINFNQSWKPEDFEKNLIDQAKDQIRKYFHIPFPDRLDVSLCRTPAVNQDSSTSNFDQYSIDLRKVQPLTSALQSKKALLTAVFTWKNIFSLTEFEILRIENDFENGPSLTAKPNFFRCWDFPEWPKYYPPAAKFFESLKVHLKNLFELKVEPEFNTKKLPKNSTKLDADLSKLLLPKTCFTRSFFFFGKNGSGKTIWSNHGFFKYKEISLKARRDISFSSGVQSKSQSIEFMENCREILINFYENSFKNKNPHAKNNVVANAFSFLNEFFPDISVTWPKVLGEIQITSRGSTISLTDLSDGQRMLLLLVLKAFTAEPQSIISIDEPELHIERNLLRSIFFSLERNRKDLFFIYCTHDLDFVRASRNSTWIYLQGPVSQSEIPDTPKVLSDSGQNVSTANDLSQKKAAQIFPSEYQIISPSIQQEIPIEALTQIYGKKPLIFVEGISDKRLLARIFLDKVEINVLNGWAKVVNSLKIIHHKHHSSTHSPIKVPGESKVIGIIDRDFFCDAQIESLFSKNYLCYFLSGANCIESAVCHPSVVEEVQKVIPNFLCKFETPKRAEFSKEFSIEKLIDTMITECSNFLSRPDVTIPTKNFVLKRVVNLYNVYNPINPTDPTKISQARIDTHFEDVKSVTVDLSNASSTASFDDKKNLLKQFCRDFRTESSTLMHSLPGIFLQALVQFFFNELELGTKMPHLSPPRQKNLLELVYYLLDFEEFAPNIIPISGLKKALIDVIFVRDEAKYFKKLIRDD